MERFLQQHQSQIVGVLTGFDRVLFRGTLPSLNNPKSLNSFLHIYKVLYRDFGCFVKQRAEQIKAHAHAIAEAHGRPYQHLSSPAASKEEIAREIMAKDGIDEGLICVLACVESCASYRIGNWHRPGIPVQRAHRQCLHFYFYYADRELGLMHIRLQSWLPFTIQVCFNGREYLAQRLRQEGIAFEQRDNCFARIDNLPRAQALLDELHQRDWTPLLHALARRVNPLLDATYGLDTRGYYWTMRQSEYATDVMFTTAAALRAVYLLLVNHAIQHLTCEDVLRFLGRRRDSRRLGEVTSDVVKRLEGTRVRHRVEENSIKMYDKQGCVLRIETTINDPRRFRVCREVTRRGKRVWRWIPMRKGVVDCARRAEVCRQANGRYLEALAVVGQPQPIAQTLDPVSRRVVKAGRPYRSLRPLTPEETALFQAVMNGQFLVHGFRNRDVRQLLMPKADRDRKRRRAASGQITRLLRLLRAHALIRKVSRTRCYRVTTKGQHLMTLALQLRQTDLGLLAA